MSNRNQIFAQLFVDELVAAGLKHAVLAPGSRNTPLVLAFAERSDIQIYSVLDERSAGFFALGLALRTGEPAAILCTSGSAAANFFPAIVEAHQSRVPLLVLTADRPHELRESGANQTIDQVNMYGHYTDWAVDMALPENQVPEVVIRNWRGIAARAIQIAKHGVVHLNFPFRKPLEPIPVPDDQIEISPREKPVYYHDPIQKTDLNWLVKLARQHEKGIIVCGPRALKNQADELSRAGIFKLGEATGYPILADSVSGMRFAENIVSSYETFLRAPDVTPPDVVIRLGNVPTSKFLNEWISKHPPQHYIHLTEDGIWADDNHLITQVVRLDFQTLADLDFPAAPPTPYHDLLCELEAKTWQNISHKMDEDHLFDGGIVHDAVQLLPAGTQLLMGNSLSIRHLDQFGRGKDIFAYANRGASGIDGNVSTACGLAAIAPTVAIMGDITFFHDMNGLLAAKQYQLPLTFVVLNNNGGGIFHRLPIRQFEPAFTDYFLTPPHLDFQHTAALYNLPYHLAESRADFRRIFAEQIALGQPNIIEVKTDSTQDFEYFKQLVQTVLKENQH